MEIAIAALGALLVFNIILNVRQAVEVEKFKERIMEQLDTLNAALDAIATEVTKLAAEQQKLIDELTAANSNPAVDLSAAITKATAIQTALAAMDELVPDAPVADPAPTDTPTA